MWMMDNHLKVNPGRTNIFSSEAVIWRYDFDIESVAKDNGDSITPSSVVKSLGVRFDSLLNFDEHVNKIVKSCNINHRNFCVISSKLSFDT